MLLVAVVMPTAHARSQGLTAADTVQLVDTPADTAYINPLPVDTLRIVDDVQHVDSAPLNAGKEAGPKGRWGRFCDSLSVGTVAVAALVLPGAGQVINRDYWKIPAIYASIGGFIYAGLRFHRQYTELKYKLTPSDYAGRVRYQSALQDVRMYRNMAFAAAGICHTLGVADAMFSHSKSYHTPMGAMVASALLPGLGQLYNGSFWKVPIIYGAAAFLTSQIASNHALYRRFNRALVALLDNDPNTVDEWEGKRSREDLQYFEDNYRRNRDLYSIGLALLYVLNVVDAYVDAHLFDWNVNKDLALRITPEAQPLWQAPGRMALAMRLNMNF